MTRNRFPGTGRWRTSDVLRHWARPVGLVLLVALAAVAAATLERGVTELKDLKSPAGAGSAEPRLSVSPSGRVLLSWLESRANGGHRLRMAWLQGDHWSPATTIAEGDSFFVNWADFPSVRPLDDDHLVAHWLWKVSADTYGYHVLTARSRDGGRTWSKPTTLHRDESPTEHGFVSLVSSSGGEGMAVWLDGHNFKGHTEGHGAGPDMAVHGTRITGSGFEDERVIDPRACDCCQTAAVATSRGVLVAYRDRSPDEIRDIALARYENGTWTPPWALHADGWIIPGCPVNGPAMAATGNDVAIAWFTAARDTPRVNVAFSSDAGQRFGPPVRIDAGHASGRVAIALLPDRTALVAWLEASGKEGTIQMRRMSPAGAMSETRIVARTSAARASGFPQLALSGGRVVTAWTEAGKPSRVRLAVGAVDAPRDR